jgi:hypothetical protein
MVKNAADGHGLLEILLLPVSQCFCIAKLTSYHSPFSTTLLRLHREIVVRAHGQRLIFPVCLCVSLCASFCLHLTMSVFAFTCLSW